MYALDESELAALERESHRVKKTVIGAASQPDDSLLISWFPDSRGTPPVPCGLAKALGPQRVADLADTVHRLRKEDILQGGAQSFLSERQARRYFLELTAYLRDLKLARKGLIVPMN